jgi:hypothetical protein
MSGSQTGGGVKSQQGFMPGGGFNGVPGYSLGGTTPAPMAGNNPAFQSPIKPMEGVGQVNQGQVDYMNKFSQPNFADQAQNRLTQSYGTPQAGPDMRPMGGPDTQPQGGLLGMNDAEMMRRKQMGY